MSEALYQYFRGVYQRYGNNNLIVLTLAAATVSLFFACPSLYGYIGPEDSLISHVKEKLAHPFMDMSGFGDQTSNRTFRLFVPLLARSLHLGLLPILLLEWLVALGILLLAYRILYLLYKDKPIAILGLMLASTCYIFFSAFADGYVAYFDVYGYFFLFLAVTMRSPMLVGAALYIASFCDERALIAAPLCYLFHTLRTSEAEDLRSFLNVHLLVLFSVVSLHILTRFLLIHFQGYHWIRLGSDQGPQFLMTAVQLRNSCIALWTMLEGGWLLVVAAALFLAHKKHYLSLIVWMMCLLASAVVALMVADTTRSMGYGYVGLFSAFVVFRRFKVERKALIQLMLVAYLLSVFPFNFVVCMRPVPIIPAPMQLLIDIHRVYPFRGLW